MIKKRQEKRISKRMISLGIFTAVLMTGISGCGVKKEEQPVTDGNEPQEQAELSQEETQKSAIQKVEKEICIPGISGEYRFVVVNDQHIVEVEDTILPEKREEAEMRRELFRSADGSYSSEAWQQMVSEINDCEPDGVILDGDMVDFFSRANWESFRKGLEKIEYPVLYVRADHDLGIWYHDNVTKEERNELEKEVDSNKGVMYWEYEDFLIVGINNNTSQMSKASLNRIKKLWELDKPVVLVMHVPLKSAVDEGLSNVCRENWNDRVLLWGKDCVYDPNEVTQQFLDMVYAPESPVVAVLGAHLHLPYEDKLNDRIVQYVFDASYKGMMGIVTIKGEP